MEYKNFFETQNEASMRLRSTIVMYDGEPVEILAVTDHVGDGTLRAYIMPIGYSEKERRDMNRPDLRQFPIDFHGMGPYLDEWIKSNPDGTVVRKELTSPKFNKFRPYPLGMCNKAPDVLYVERQPNRSIEQGLIKPMLHIRKVSAAFADGGEYGEDLYAYSLEMKACILGEHPSPYRCLEGLTNPKYENNAAAFHRQFALVKGPIDMLFLAYKADVVGVLSNGDFSKVKLGENFKYTKEAISELNLFENIV